MVCYGRKINNMRGGQLQGRECQVDVHHIPLSTRHCVNGEPVLDWMHVPTIETIKHVSWAMRPINFYFKGKLFSNLQVLRHSQLLCFWFTF